MNPRSVAPRTGVTSINLNHMKWSMNQREKSLRKNSGMIPTARAILVKENRIQGFPMAGGFIWIFTYWNIDILIIPTLSSWSNLIGMPKLFFLTQRFFASVPLLRAWHGEQISPDRTVHLSAGHAEVDATKFATPRQDFRHLVAFFPSQNLGKLTK